MKQNNYIVFDILFAGDKFLHNNEVYIKTNDLRCDSGCINAVKVLTGRLTYIEPKTQVKKCKGE